MIGRWVHPLVILAGILAVATFLILNALGVFGFVNSLVEIQGGAGWDLMRQDWPYIISGWFWVSGFAVGLVGFLINILNVFRCGTSRITDFSLLRSLSRQESQELTIWLNENTYGWEHLKTLWGEHDE